MFIIFLDMHMIYYLKIYIYMYYVYTLYIYIIYIHYIYYIYTLYILYVLYIYIIYNIYYIYLFATKPVGIFVGPTLSLEFRTFVKVLRSYTPCKRSVNCPSLCHFARSVGRRAGPRGRMGGGRSNFRGNFAKARC